MGETCLPTRVRNLAGGNWPCRKRDNISSNGELASRAETKNTTKKSTSSNESRAQLVDGGDSVQGKGMRWGHESTSGGHRNAKKGVQFAEEVRILRSGEIGYILTK